MEQNEFEKSIDDIADYVGLGPEDSILDGYFTSQDLRQIADAMDKWKQAELSIKGEKS